MENIFKMTKFAMQNDLSTQRPRGLIRNSQKNKSVKWWTAEQLLKRNVSFQKVPLILHVPYSVILNKLLNQAFDKEL